MSVETWASVKMEPTKNRHTQPGGVEQVVAMPLYEFAEFGPCQTLFCCVCVAFLSPCFHLSSVFKLVVVKCRSYLATATFRKASSETLMNVYEIQGGSGGGHSLADVRTFYFLFVC